MTLAELIAAHVHPLQTRLRGTAIDAIAKALIADEATFGVDWPAGGDPERLRRLLPRVQSMVVRLETEISDEKSRWEAFESDWRHAPEKERRAKVEAWIRATVPSRFARRADLRALDRWMGVDALEERSEAARHPRQVALEIALAFLGRAAHLALVAVGESALENLVAEMIDGARLHEFLRARAEGGDRWQARLAALEGLVRVCRPLRRLRPGTSLDALVACALARGADRDEHPWAQAAAVQLALVLDREAGVKLLEKRLLDSSGFHAPRDFLVRRLCVELVTKELPTPEGLALLVRVAAARDPSEHVRMGLCEAIAGFSRFGSLSLLGPLAGLDGRPEPSAKVRASAAIAARRIASAAAAAPLYPEGASLSEALELLAAILQRDADPMVMEIACEEIATVVIDLSRAGLHARLVEVAPDLLVALLSIRGQARRSPHVHEVASAAAEVIDRETNPARRLWTAFLRDSVRAVPAGGTARIPLDAAGLPPVADPLWIGRVLADVTRRDWGISFRFEENAIVVWRGDHFRRRLWRVLWELRSPAPNKRQGHSHTIGRVQHGDYRAHPGWLDEVNATVVPGERVFIEQEGSWGRHLPSVDDVLDAPGPVRLFSSYGVTTITPPESAQARRNNGWKISFRYASLAALRLASLSGMESRQRRQWLETLERDFGVRVVFEPWTYALHPAPVPVSVHLKALFPSWVDEASEPAAAPSFRKTVLS